MQSLSDIWDIVIAEMEKDYSDVMINLWFRPLKLVSLEGRTAEIMCESNFRRDLIAGRHREAISKRLSDVFGFDVEVIFTSEQDNMSVMPEETPAALGSPQGRQHNPQTMPQGGQHNPQTMPQGGAKQLPPNLGDISQSEPEPSFYAVSGRDAFASGSGTFVPGRDAYAAGGVRQDTAKSANLPPPVQEDNILSLSGGDTRVQNHAAQLSTYKNEYTFENYIVGNSNKFAHAACTAVANNPASGYNPLFIYGASGLGKTHLLYAITNEIMRRNPQANIIYVKGEEFTNQMIESVSRNIAPQFRDKYRRADVLLIDDIQFIAGRDATQEEFFHTFNALYEDRKQIIMTSDRPPRDIKTLEDRLKTRFEWGLIADVQPPDFELRIAIMKNKAQLLGLDIPNDVFEFLAENLKSNVRQIEGAVKKIGAQSYLSNLPITRELAVSCISDLLTGSEPVAVTVDKILERVSKKYNVTIEDLKGRKRTKDIATPRHICIYIIRKLTDMSLPQIARIFGRDHTTIMSSIDTVDKELKSNSLLEIEINELIKDIKE